MRHGIQSSASFLALAMCLSLVSSSPALGDSARAAQVEKALIETETENTCTAEPIQASGEVHFVTQVFERPDGSVHAISQVIFSNFVGTGATGTEYVLVNAFHQIINTNFTAAQTGTENLSFLLVSQGDEENLVVDAVFHITLNANGTVTSSVDQFRVRCAG